MLSVISVADMNRTIAQNLWRIDRTKFDVVVGIPRSGMIPASLLATHLQLPLTDVDSFARGVAFARSGVVVTPGSRVLLVDDTANRGGAMGRALDQLKGSYGSVTRFVVYGPYREDKSFIDLSFAECPGPRVFQWNMWKHIRLPKWGFDLDGVFCREPTKEENDDGEKYLRFIATTEAQFLPTKPIGHIVTGRLERYRPETVAQLARYGIQYESLTMMPYATKAERMAAGGRGAWKARKAQDLGVEMFIESNAGQAQVIARDAGIPVWCTLTQEVYR